MGLALTIAVVGVISISTRGFRWMTGVIVPSAVIWLGARYIEGRKA